MTDSSAYPGLDTSFRLGEHGDEVYCALIAAHGGLSNEASARLNARLVLLLANQVGDGRAVVDAIRRARDGLVGGRGDGSAPASQT